MELQDEKMSFDDRNVSAYLNRSYSDGFSPPPDICGKQRHSNGYLQACSRHEKGISSNHDYFSVQGSIRCDSQVDKVSEKPPDLPRSKYITNQEESMHHNIKEEVNELDDVGIYYEIAHSTKRRTSGQSDVKCFDQQEYVLRPADDYCLTQDKETTKPSANYPCSACRIIILTAITILLIGFCCAAYFLWIRNINENEKTATLNNTQHIITSTIVSGTFGTPILSTEAQTDTLTNPASTLTTSTDQVLTTTKESSTSAAPSSSTETYCSHNCEAYVGYPAGDLSIEILKYGELEFRKLDVITESTEDNKTSCEIHRKINFRIVFTSDMEKAIIRCSVINKHFPDSPAFHSQNETVFLIPGDACKDNSVSQSHRVHPSNCHYYIECQNKEPYGRACQYNFCFGIYTVETCSPCNDVTCPATSTSCTNTTVVQQQNKAEMTIHSDQVAGLTSPRPSNLHICTGFIGNSTGDIKVQIKLAGSDNYQTIIPIYTTSTDTTENCGIRRVLKFWIGFTVSMYNATIRCKVTNGIHQDVSPIYSNSETLILVSSDFCNQNFNGTIGNRYHHPAACNKFVTCVGNMPYVTACASGLCFSFEKDFCDFCNLVKTCP